MRRITFFLAMMALAGCTGTQQPTTSSVPASSSAPVELKTYTNAANGYSIGYPPTWTIQENVRFEGPEVTEVGTVITPPASDTAGTNLVKAQAEIAVLDGACPIVQTPQQETPVVIDKVQFEHDLWGDMSAGNTEETITYQTSRSNKCYRIVYYRLFCTPGTSCTPDRTIHFAPGPQVHLFEAMARSFKFL